MNKKILVLGGTGAMGTYLVPELVQMGYKADVVSLDERQSDNNVTYIKANAMDDEYLKKLLQNGYDAVVDFMIYSIPQFRNRYPLFMENTNHYIFLSSYRLPLLRQVISLLPAAKQPHGVGLFLCR